MTQGLNIAGVAALVGDPGRANILAVLLDGRALTAKELAAVAGVTAATASGHLGKLVEGGLLAVASQGRHRYFRLASGDVARMLEAILAVAGIGADASGTHRATPRVPPALRDARTCYDHLAGRTAVAITDALLARGAIILTPEAGEVTEVGRSLFGDLGVAMTPPSRSRRLYCRPCLDWSERRAHLGGSIGAALFDRLIALDWLRRGRESRVVTVTPKGRLGLEETFGCVL